MDHRTLREDYPIRGTQGIAFDSWDDEFPSILMWEEKGTDTIVKIDGYESLETLAEIAESMTFSPFQSFEKEEDSP